MKVVFVLFDSLNRLALGAYGGTSVPTPNFDRFARERAVTFDGHYVGSLPCMPARRDMHTGRLNFMHRSWGPLEPFDNSCFELLTRAGVHTHLVSDHLHYFEDGGGGYHTRFKTYDFVRGQEYDPWIAMAKPPVERLREAYHARHYDFGAHPKRLQGAVNREVIREEADYPGPQCFARAFEFLDRNAGTDDWLLQIECFDPHEPFHSPERFRAMFPTGYEGPVLDWPNYAKVTESEAEIAEIRANYAALVAMCDEYFGRLLDRFDADVLWDDTALILSTDHGFLLAEHDWWAKCRQPYYEEIAHVPLMVAHPAHRDRAGERRAALTQTGDLMPTFLELFGQPVPREVRARSVLPLVGEDGAHHEAVVFGVFGGPIGVTDGRHALYHYPPDTRAEGLHEYTLAPQHMTGPFELRELRTATLDPGFDFTKGAPVLRIDALADAKRVPMNDGLGWGDDETMLFDLRADPRQERPCRDAAVEERLHGEIARILREHDTPREVFDWYRLPVAAPAPA